jgi:hypothetical protein
MAQTGYTPIQLYYSTTAAAVPTSGNLLSGELAINITDGKLYFKNNSNVVTLLASSANSSADVTGPVSSTDNAVARFDGTTGKIIQNSGVTIDDSNNISSAGSVTGVSFIPSGATVATNGLYLPASNTVALSTNSTERMRIDSAGRVSVGSSGTIAGQSFRVNLPITGSTTSYGVVSATTVQSDVTVAGMGYRSNLSTAAASFTVTDLIGYIAEQATIGAGSTVTNQYGFLAQSSLTGATNNYGFYSNIASGTGRWNFYANGTAANYFGGQVQLNQDYIEKRFTANSSTAITLDLANGTMQDITLTGTATITMPTAVAGKSFILLLRSGAGSYSVTWTTVKWPGGTAPTVTTTASRLDIYSFFSDGTNWYGITVSQNYTP